MYAIGTIPRRSQDKYFNTGFVIGPKGDLVTKMDKIHLFDIDIPGTFLGYMCRENHL
jgi:predicted amidohydrolase